MTPSERMTWRVMKVYRRWSVFLALQILTVIWWTHPGLFPGGLPSWNYVWSDLAIIVEMMVGIAFLNQAMRDGAVLRQEMRELHEEMALLRKIADRLGIDEATNKEPS
jgi:hypothetical protein